MPEANPNAAPYTADLALLQSAAHTAADIALRHFRGNYQTWDKPGGAGPVTEADLEIDAMLRDTLTTARPTYGWLSEETEDDAARLTKPNTFIIDPIDGTRAFAAGEKHWGHSLAIAENGQITAAVVAMPAIGKIYWATRGGGARDETGPLQVSPQSNLDQAQILATKPNMDPAFWPNGTPGFKRHHRSSLAYRMALTASGRFDAMLTFRPTWEWDIAAGTLLVTEAGGTATDQSGAPLTFNSAKAQTHGVIAGGPTHREIIAIRG
ncbi:3'(2'),5'-bisphosphate nucleotidase CysQ [Alphaproteobacteria bacterium KMM 3653]|uniref:3'(2'),5'-bisphosphate nucleotidase CysQ n=1 Tax=Harenicola maris TaxID=2841044 RepID=A0AAP2G456_9RHOB|nr:3'(2'),5'-bisphosphate nucleotidase CysQ [Harenicola maris]